MRLDHPVNPKVLDSGIQLNPRHIHVELESDRLEETPENSRPGLEDQTGLGLESLTLSLTPVPETSIIRRLYHTLRQKSGRDGQELPFYYLLDAPRNTPLVSTPSSRSASLQCISGQ